MMGCVKEGDGGLKGAFEDKNRETFFGGAGGSTDPFPGGLSPLSQSRRYACAVRDTHWWSRDTEL